MQKKYLSLEGICDKYDFVLVDTCSFRRSLKQRFSNKNKTFEKLQYVKAENQRLKYWKKGVFCNPQIYCTKKVLEEWGGKSYNYKKALKHHFIKKNRDLLELRRLLRTNNQIKKFIIDSLEYSKRILNFEESKKELYDNLSDKHSHLKKEIGGVDFDLLISGGILNKLNNSVVIISQDFYLLKTWRKFLKNEKIPKPFEFYISRKTNFFERAFDFDTLS